jgi:hypothetical protein
MAIIDNTLAAQVPTFDPATPLMQAAKLQAADQESRQAQFKQAQIELGTEARGLAAVQNSPEFPKLWAEAADRMKAKGLLDDRAHAQWRNTPSPLLLKQMIAQTEDPTLQFRKQEALRDQGNTDRSFELQKTTSDRNFDLAKRRLDEDKFTIKETVDPNSGASKFVRLKTTGPEGVIDTGAVPSTPANPSINPKSPFNQAMAKQDAERVTGYSDASKLAEDGLATLDNIDSLRKEAYTGGPFGIVGAAASKLGHGATQALETNTSALALDVAQKMKGSLSDKDIAFVKQQVPNTAQGGAAGESASGAIRAGFERTKQRAAFYRTWSEKNGNINGADVAWNKYITENPLTTEDKKSLGGRKFDPNYNRDFSRYIKNGQSGYGSSGDSILAYARDALAQGAPRAEIEKRLRDGGIDPKDL